MQEAEATSHVLALPLPMFPAGVDLRWETTNCLVWNDRELIAEKQELIYEVAWIPELGIWRRFLRSRRNCLTEDSVCTSIRRRGPV